MGARGADPPPPERRFLFFLLITIKRGTAWHIPRRCAMLVRRSTDSLYLLSITPSSAVRHDYAITKTLWQDDVMAHEGPHSYWPASPPFSGRRAGAGHPRTAPGARVPGLRVSTNCVRP